MHDQILWEVERIKDNALTEMGLRSWAAAPAGAKSRDNWRQFISGPTTHLGRNKELI